MIAVGMRTLLVGIVGAAAAASLTLAGSSTAVPGAEAACSPQATILESPRLRSREVQLKANNDRGDIVGFADSNGGKSAIHAILWKGGTAAGAVDLGVLPGYVASEAYGVNDRRVVFGLLYDKRGRTFPFRWEQGRMTLLKGPSGRVQPTNENPGSGGRNAINERGEIAWTMVVGGHRRAVRWSSDGSATYLPALPGHTWTNAFGINDDGVVSGWSRRLPNEDGEENPVLWTRAGKVVPLKTAPGQADGIAEATNRAGLSVGYLGNLGTAKDPERDQVAIWRTRDAEPLLIGPWRTYRIAELVDVNDRGQAAGMMGTIDPRNGFHRDGRAVVWRTGWTELRPIGLPAASRRANPVLVPQLNDINNAGTIVGSVFGLAGPDYGKLRRIDPVVWTCQFGR
jgi:hypothetical protein